MRGRPSRSAGVLAVALLALVAGCSAGAQPTPSAPAPSTAGPARPVARTVVSLTFDDGNRTHYLVRPILLDHGMTATFYIVSGFVDHPDGSTMTWDQIRGLAADGNDIGGHTRDHRVLPTLSAAEQRREVCDDRDRLLALGFRPVSFAYPTGLSDASSANAVRQCGYRTGRTAGDVSEFGPNYAARTPPADPYATPALDTPPTGPLTTQYLQTAVRAAAAHGGGWVPIVLHQVCRPSEADYARCMASEGPVDLGVFSDFVDWLAHDAPAGTVVLPVSAVVGAD